MDIGYSDRGPEAMANATRAVGPGVPAGETVQRSFWGRGRDGSTALIRRTASADYAQFDKLDHPQSHGWWPYPRGHFAVERP